MARVFNKKRHELAIPSLIHDVMFMRNFGY
jgi:hypothetical protein